MELIYVESKLIFVIVSFTKFHFTLSYVLLISSLTAICPFFPIFFHFTYASKSLSEINRPGTKALCASSIHFSKTSRNLLVIVFAII